MADMYRNEEDEEGRKGDIGDITSERRVKVSRKEEKQREKGIERKE